MRSRITLGLGCLLLASLGSVRAQDAAWRTTRPAEVTAPTVSLGQPTRLDGGADIAVCGATDNGVASFRPIARAQAGDPPIPPPPFPGGGGVVAPVPSSTDLYNKGMVNNDADLGGFWTRTGDKFRRIWEDVSGGASGAFQSTPNRKMFQSDQEFNNFASPVTNPFFFEDPRALTEIRPFFIWQHTSNSNPVWAGGNNYDYGFRGSVAITQNISLVINRLGFTTIQPRNPTPTIQSNTGFSEFLLGPKFTIIRSETSGTVAAIGLTFDIPCGNADVLQRTGHLALIPYFSIAQNFGKSQYGSFNFMNTTGYQFRTDNTRTESFYSSFHLDYDVGGAHRFYPLIELNWRYYTRNGGNEPLNFDGNDLANFGSQNVSGLNELTLALGGRVKINNFWWWGLAAEFNVLGNSDRHLDAFRLTTDFIFRY